LCSICVDHVAGTPDCQHRSVSDADLIRDDLRGYVVGAPRHRWTTLAMLAPRPER
jgi:hypothetical protein